MKHLSVLAMCLISALSFMALAQQQIQPAADKPVSASLGVFVYPKNNQSMEQQKTDEMDCFSWAKQQTGIDPTVPAPPPQREQAQQTAKQEKDAPKGGAIKGAAGGAIAGTAIGAIAGDAGEGAAIGATAGAIRGRRAQKKAEKQAEAQAKTAQQQAELQAGQQAQSREKERKATFNRAFGACLEGKGYTVK